MAARETKQYPTQRIQHHHIAGTLLFALVALLIYRSPKLTLAVLFLIGAHLTVTTVGIQCIQQSLKEASDTFEKYEPNKAATAHIKIPLSTLMAYQFLLNQPNHFKSNHMSALSLAGDCLHPMPVKTTEQVTTLLKACCGKKPAENKGRRQLINTLIQSAFVKLNRAEKCWLELWCQHLALIMPILQPGHITFRIYAIHHVTPNKLLASFQAHLGRTTSIHATRTSIFITPHNPFMFITPDKSDCQRWNKALRSPPL